MAGKTNKLLLLHGALGSAEQFSELQNLLLPDIESFSFNFSGHGGTPQKENFSIDFFTEETVSFIEEKKLVPVNIFGYSMGGYVALRLAMKHPAYAEKIMTLGTKFNWSKESAEKELRLLDPVAMEAKIPAFVESLRQRHQPVEWKTVVQRTAELMRRLGNGDAMGAGDFKKIPNEILICIGSEDNMVTIDESQMVAEALDKGKLKIIDGLKHPLESVDKRILSDNIKEFIISD